MKVSYRARIYSNWIDKFKFEMTVYLSLEGLVIFNSIIG